MHALGFLFVTGASFVCFVTGFLWWVRAIWAWVAGFFANSRLGG